MSERKKFSKIWILLIAISLIVSIGAIWSWCVFVKKENNADFTNLDSWSSFWGGIIGAGATIVAAFLVMYFQIKEESSARNKDNVDNTFFNLLNLHVGSKDQLLSKNNKNIESIFQKILKSEESLRRNIAENELKKIFNDNKESIILKVDKKISNLISELSTHNSFDYNYKILKRDYSSSDENGLNHIGYKILKLFESTSSYENYVTANNEDDPGNLFFDYRHIYEVNYDELKDKIYYYYKFKRLDTLQQIKYFIQESEKIYLTNYSNSKVDKKFDHLKKETIQFLPEHTKNKKILRNETSRIEDPLPRKNKVEIIDDVLNSEYHLIGSFLRFFYRIIKYINDNVDDPKIKKNYLGFLRATLDENLMLLIFYNATYATSGEKMGDELLNTNFFGDKLDFDKNNKNTPFIRYEKLIFGHEDLEEMKKYFA